MAHVLSLRALALVAACSACVTNSPGRYRGVPLDPTSPVLAFQERIQQPGRDKKLEREALWHLEDLVEDAAGRLCGQEVDFATPTLVGPLGRIEILDREPAKPGEDRLSGYFGVPYFGLDLLGLKYLLDHLGPSFSEVEEPAPARAICGTIGEFLDGELERDEALRRLRASEAALCADLGISEHDLTRSAQRYDSATGLLYAFTNLDGGERPHITICLPTMTLDPRNLVHVYAHELMHCLMISSHPVHPVMAFLDPRGESTELQTLEELACETFAELVVADLTERGLLAAPAESAHSVGIPTADERAENHREIVERMERLRSLYRDPSVSFRAMREVAERYGEVGGEVDPGHVSSLIAGCIRSLGAQEFARRMWKLTGVRDLERLHGTCTPQAPGPAVAHAKEDPATEG